MPHFTESELGAKRFFSGQPNEKLAFNLWGGYTTKEALAKKLSKKDLTLLIALIEDCKVAGWLDKDNPK